ncbi:MAG: hypothetical protein MSA33_00255 [Campylobacter sp.]|nr:hypothetical protein [Campylobacter sp.]
MKITCFSFISQIPKRYFYIKAICLADLVKIAIFTSIKNIRQVISIESLGYHVRYAL